MNSKSEKLLEIRDIQEKLKTLSSRVDNLENLSSRHYNNNGELQVVTTEKPNNENRHQVYSFLV